MVAFDEEPSVCSSSLSSATLQLTGHTRSGYALEYAPSGTALCSASFDKTVLLSQSTHSSSSQTIIIARSVPRISTILIFCVDTRNTCKAVLYYRPMVRSFRPSPWPGRKRKKLCTSHELLTVGNHESSACTVDSRLQQKVGVSFVLIS
jgi:hypothetical protein